MKARSKKMTKKAEVKKEEKVEVTPTIQDIVVGELVRDNSVSFQEVLKTVKSYYPESRFSKACFYWYRRHTNATGLTSPKINHDGKNK